MLRFVSLSSVLLSGLLFGVGMMLSGMVDPARVLGFLDMAGSWDPALAFVMGGALAVYMPAYFLFIRKQAKPVCSDHFQLNHNKTLDFKLIFGAALFGVGWGLAGICPGPAMTAVASFNSDILLFIAAMLAGMALATVNQFFTQKQ